MNAAAQLFHDRTFVGTRLNPLSESNPIELVCTMPNSAQMLASVLQGAEWNEHRMRTVVDGPHRHVSDIWVRCLDWKVMQRNPADFNLPHRSSWYPKTSGILRMAKSIAIDIYNYIGGEQLGGVLITKIPAGCCVMPHIDHGWHARFYEKYALSIQAEAPQEFCFEKKRLTTQQGDVFTFDNRYSHWVTNPSPQDRITMIVCIKRPAPPDKNGPT